MSLEYLNDDAIRNRHEAALQKCARAQFLSRPSIMLGARVHLKLDGNAWGAVLDGNLAESVAGFGPTPDIAMEAFDKAWHAALAPATSKETCNVCHQVEHAAGCRAAPEGGV